jgi:hypothetical protein
LEAVLLLQLLTLASGRVSVAGPSLLALRTRLVEALLVLHKPFRNLLKLFSFEAPIVGVK